MKKIVKLSVSCVSVVALIILYFQATSHGQKTTIDLKENHPSNISDNNRAQNILPNLRFGSINVHSRKGTYDIIAFKDYDYSVTLFAENTSVKNIRVRAGVENIGIFYDRVFPYISSDAPKRIVFIYAMPIGTHTMYVEVDPDNTITELNETDNRTTRTFISDLRIWVH